MLFQIWNINSKNYECFLRFGTLILKNRNVSNENDATVPNKHKIWETT